MELHSVLANPEPVRDQLVGQPLRQHRKHFRLAQAKRLLHFLLRYAPVPQRRLHHSQRFGHGLNCSRNFLRARIESQRAAQVTAQRMKFGVVREQHNRAGTVSQRTPRIFIG